MRKLFLHYSLEKKLLQEQAIKLQKAALIGQMASNLLHEVNHHLSPLNFALETLDEDIKSLENPQNLPGTNNLPIYEDFEKVRASVAKITNTVKMFRRILQSGKDEIIRLDALIQETIKLLEETARSSKVVFVQEKYDGLILLHSQFTLLQQVFLNVFLNAIEQISKFSLPYISE